MRRETIRIVESRECVCVCLCFFVFSSNFLDQLGRVSLRISFADEETFSGNLMSKSTIKSPFFDGSFGKGSPSPLIFFLVVGFVTSVKDKGIFRPSSVGA